MAVVSTVTTHRRWQWALKMAMRNIGDEVVRVLWDSSGTTYITVIHLLGYKVPAIVGWQHSVWWKYWRRRHPPIWEISLFPPINLTVASHTEPALPLDLQLGIGLMLLRMVIVILQLIITLIIKNCWLTRDMIIRTAVSLSSPLGLRALFL